MSVVCGTDFSETAARALSVAGILARRLGEPLHLVHVMEPDTSALDAAMQAELRRSADQRLSLAAKALAAQAKAAVTPALLAGPPAETLAAFAKEHGARALVVASRGASASPIFHVGGTSERVARCAEVPVLVVQDAAPFEAWDAGGRPLRVLLGVDWTASCEGAIRWVKALRLAGPCDVSVAHVYWPDLANEGERRYGFSLRERPLVANPEAEALLLRDLGTRVGDLGGTGRVDFRVEPGLGRIGDQLLDVAVREDAQLIAVGTHRRRGPGRLSSVANVALHFSRASVAVVPATATAPLAPEEIPRFRRVLVTTDLSPLASYAVPFAYTLAGEGGEVFLLSVITDPKGPPGEAEVSAQLRALIPKQAASSAHVVTHVEAIRNADAARCIAEMAERRGVDAICMASHGRSGVQRTLLGSVAETVVRSAHRPVLIVRPPPA